MKIDITRIDGKIRVVSTEFGQEHVDEFHDYGLPEVDNLILASMKGDIAHHASIRGIYYVFGDYSYAVSSHVYIHSRDYKDSYIITSKHVTGIYIEKSITIIDYGTYLCIINGSSKFTIDSDNYDRNRIFSWESKNFAKHFNGRHITKQSLEKYAAVVFYRALPFRMEVMVNYRPMDFDKSTKLKNSKHS